MSIARGIRLAALAALLYALAWWQFGPGVENQFVGWRLEKLQAGIGAQSITVDPALSRGLVVSGLDGGNQTLFDTRTHRVVRTLAVGPTVHAAPAIFDARHRHAFMAVGGSYFQQQRASLWMLDAGDGAILGRTRLDIGVNSLAIDPAVSRLFVGTSDGHIDVLDTRSGLLIRSIPTTIAIVAFAVDTLRHHIFAVQPWQFVEHPNPRHPRRTTGLIYMLDSRTGTIVRATTVGIEPNGIIVDAQTGRVFVANMGDQVVRPSTQSVSILDARSGRYLRSVMVGPSPTLLGLDALRHRVVIEDSESRVIQILDSHSGNLVRSIPVDGSPRRLIMDEHLGYAIFTYLDTQAITVLDISSGKIVQNVQLDAAVSEAPAGLALDPARHQIYAVQGVQHAVVILNEPS